MQTINPGFKRTTPVGPAPAWRQRARKALDNWSPSSEIFVAVELKVAFRDGIRHAAKFVEERGDRDLAMAIRRLAEEGQKGP